jgi:DNA-binding MarR family transcriptional regulator
MAKAMPVDRTVVREVRDNCLCFATQKAARALARRFDRIFAGLGITNGQYSMMLAVRGMGAPKALDLASFLAMDRATVTAALKKLAERKLVGVRKDEDDGRARRVTLTAKGEALLAEAVPLWRAGHAEIEKELPQGDPEMLRRGLHHVSRELRAR